VDSEPDDLMEDDAARSDLLGAGQFVESNLLLVGLRCPPQHGSGKGHELNEKQGLFDVATPEQRSIYHSFVELEEEGRNLGIGAGGG
jgi:hypothetical protein